MQYINKNTGECAANLNYGTHPGTWEIRPYYSNRYRVLKKGNTITAIDLNIGSGMIEVGKMLPGYNKVIESIEHVVEDDGTDEGREFFEVTCYLKQRSYIQAKSSEKMIKDINNPQFNIANVPFDERVDCLNQLSDARDNGVITQDEMLNIACVEWFDQYKISKLISNG